MNDTKTALVIVDIQNDYFPGGRMELEGSLEAANRAREALSLFREKSLPIVHIQHVSVRPGATFFLPDTQGVEIHTSVSPLPGEPVIRKHYPNSFRETPLLDHLRQNGIGHIVIAGMMTHMCVDATTRAAFDEGFRCTVLHDACATMSLSFGGEAVSARQVHAAFLAALGGIYAQVLGTADAIASLKA